MLIFGGVLVLLGFLLCLTIIGSIIGVPLIMLGSIFMFIGLLGRRKTVITNVIQVSNTVPAAPLSPPPLRQAIPAPAQYTAPVSLAPVSVAAAATPLIQDAQTKHCAACSSRNLSDNRFCTECGAALSMA